MNEQNLKRITDERLEYGISLRESTDFIKGRAIVELMMERIGNGYTQIFHQENKF